MLFPFFFFFFCLLFACSDDVVISMLGLNIYIFLLQKASLSLFFLAK